MARGVETEECECTVPKIQCYTVMLFPSCNNTVKSGVVSVGVFDSDIDQLPFFPTGSGQSWNTWS